MPPKSPPSRSDLKLLIYPRTFPEGETSPPFFCLPTHFSLSLSSFLSPSFFLPAPPPLFLSALALLLVCPIIVCAPPPSSFSCQPPNCSYWLPFIFTGSAPPPTICLSICLLASFLKSPSCCIFSHRHLPAQVSTSCCNLRNNKNTRRSCRPLCFPRMLLRVNLSSLYSSMPRLKTFRKSTCNCLSIEYFADSHIFPVNFSFSM